MNKTVINSSGSYPGMPGAGGGGMPTPSPQGSRPIPGSSPPGPGGAPPPMPGGPQGQGGPPDAQKMLPIVLQVLFGIAAQAKQSNPAAGDQIKQGIDQIMQGIQQLGGPGQANAPGQSLNTPMSNSPVGAPSGPPSGKLSQPGM